MVWSILVFQVTGADGPVQEGNWPARGHNLRFVEIRLTINVYSQFGVFLVPPSVWFLFSIDIVFSGWALLRPESNYLNDHHFPSNAWFGRWCAVSEGRSQNFRILLVTLWDKPDACEYKCSHFFGTALERTTYNSVSSPLWWINMARIVEKTRTTHDANIAFKQRI